MSTTDYSKMPLEELLKEEKKLKNGRLLNGVLIGSMVGVVAYRLATHGFGLLAIALPVALSLIFSRSMQTQDKNLAAVKEEIARKEGRR